MSSSQDSGAGSSDPLLPAGAASTLSFSQSRDDSDSMSDLSKDTIPVARLKNSPELAGKNARGRIESVREDEREKSRSKSRDRKPSLQRVAEDDEDGPSRGTYGKTWVVLLLSAAVVRLVRRKAEQQNRRSHFH